MKNITYKNPYVLMTFGNLGKESGKCIFDVKVKYVGENPYL
jgi:hypothetical protein